MELIVCSNLPQVCVCTWSPCVRVDDGDLHIRENLPTLHEAHAVGCPSLQKGNSVNTKCTLVHIHAGGLWVLRTLVVRDQGT